MSEKLECPGCKSYTSAVYAAFTGERDSCPHCDLSGNAIREVLRARELGANAELTEKYAAQVDRLDRAEREVLRLRRVLDRARRALADDDLEGEVQP